MMYDDNRRVRLSGPLRDATFAGHSVVSADLLRRIESRYEFNAEELKLVSGAFTKAADYKPGARLASFGEPYGRLALVAGGWMARSRYLPSGGRQIIEFILPGEIVLPSLEIGAPMNHDIEALTACSVIFADRDRLANPDDHQAIVQAFAPMIVQQDLELLRESVINLGRRTAVERMAYLFLQLQDRLNIADEPKPAKVRIPISQRDLSDKLGMSLVHCNKTLRRMEENGWIERSGDTVIIVAAEELRDLCDFDATSLLTRRPSRAAG